MHPRFLALTLAAALVAAAAPTALARSISFTCNNDDNVKFQTCDDADMQFWKHRKGDLANARKSETVSLRASASTPFEITSPNYGGVRVQPSQDGKFSASVCLAAGADSDEEAERILDQVRIVNDQGELRVEGPKDEDWGAYIIVSAPNGTALDMRALNGTLSVRDASGRFTLHSTNGPISVNGASGTIDAETQNGPIQFSGHGGDIRLESQNGPVAVSLDANEWSGKGLEGSTVNGPISMTAPNGVKTGVLVEGSSVSPIQWEGHGQWQGRYGPHSFQLGDGAIRVRLSTQNGPVSVKGPRRAPRGTEI